MAATQKSSSLVRDIPVPTQEVDFSAIQFNLDEDIALLGPSGLAPASVSFQMVNSATDNSLVYGVWDPDNNDTSADTITVRFHGTGDPTGAVVRCHIEWNGAASGGISA